MRLYLGLLITFLAIVGLVCHLLFWLSLTSVIKPSVFQHVLVNACKDRNTDPPGVVVICDPGDHAYYYAFFTVPCVYPPTIAISIVTYLWLRPKGRSIPIWKILGIVLGIFTVGYAVIGFM
jgi:hypothetical protein